MATLPLFSDSTPLKQTDDSDASRLNDFPSIIRDNDGKLILFYEKEFKSGLTSGGEVTFTAPSLSCHVNAGTGEINEIGVSWSGADLSLTPDTYTLVYVDNLGNVGRTDDFPISLIKNVIVLAYVNVGTTSIVRINTVEKTGFYIFNRRQILIGSDYVWDGYEYRLNVGANPEAFFDSSANKAYCTFIKDGNTFIRVFDMTSAETWEDLAHVEEISGILYPLPQPRNDVTVKSGTDKGIWTSYQPPLYVIARNMPVGLMKDSTVAYVHLPYVSSSYISSAIPPLRMEVFTKDGTNYNLETTLDLTSVERYSQLETQWVNTTGLKYLGLRITHRLYGGDYVTDPVDYSTARIPTTLDYTELLDSTHRTTIYPEIYPMSISIDKGDWTKAVEYDQFYKFVDEDQTNTRMSTSKGDWTKALEYDQVYKFVDDDQTNIRIGMSIGVQTITSV